MDRLADAAWPGPLVWYAFLGGVAAGSYATAAAARLFGTEADRRATRPARLLAFPLVAACLGLLAADASRGGRAWGRLGLVGRSALAALGVVSLGSFLAALQEGGRFQALPGAGRLVVLGRSPLGKVAAVAGVVAALGVGSSVAPLPAVEWVGPGWLGAVFLASAAATGPAAVVLLARWRGAVPADDSVSRLTTATAGAIVVELALLTALTLSLRGFSGLALQRWPGMLIPLFVVPLGLVLPLVLRQVRGPRGAVDAAWLVLLGGFVLRAAVAGIPASLTLR
jgi:formate-dependent nitrite reductase membrane component NrfD